MSSASNWAIPNICTYTFYECFLCNFWVQNIINANVCDWVCLFLIIPVSAEMDETCMQHSSCPGIICYILSRSRNLQNYKTHGNSRAALLLAFARGSADVVTRSKVAYIYATGYNLFIFQVHRKGPIAWTLRKDKPRLGTFCEGPRERHPLL